MLQTVMILLQLVAAVVLAVEALLHWRLTTSVMTWPALVHPPDGLPDTVDPALLVGAEGQTPSLHYRWEPGLGLLFRRKLRPVGGEWGHPAGVVRVGPSGLQVHWHPFPLTVAPLIVLIATGGTVGLWLEEGEAMAFVVIPISLVVGIAFAAMQWHTARGLLRRRGLQELAAVLSGARE